jgi:hypothetical protein
MALIDGVAGVTTTTGTGSYAITGNKDGYREFSQIADGTLITLVVRTSADFEIGRYTKSGGSSPVLARTTILRNKAGTTSAVSWGAGEKQVHSTLASADLPNLGAQNAFLDHQFFEGNRVVLDDSRTSYLQASVNDQPEMTVAGEVTTRWNLGAMRLRLADDGAAQGPNHYLWRVSASPAASDNLGGIVFLGRDSAGNDTEYATIVGGIISPTNGTEQGRVTINVMDVGTAIEALQVQNNNIRMFSAGGTGKRFLVGKTGTSFGTVGAEISADGLLTVTRSGISNVVSINRLGGDGGLLTFWVDSVAVGSISSAAGVVTYGTFVGNHPSSPVDRTGDVPKGAVVCTVDEAHYPDGRKPWLPKFRLSDRRADPRVYGSFSGHVDEDGDWLINAEGAWQALVKGPVEGGDLLWTSDTPGVAEVQADRHAPGAWTLGKVQMSDRRDEVRLVAVRFS